LTATSFNCAPRVGSGCPVGETAVDPDHPLFAASKGLADAPMSSIEIVAMSPSRALTPNVPKQIFRMNFAYKFF
jgi:hypothetical protein